MTPFIRPTVAAAILAIAIATPLLAAEPITIRTGTAGELADNCATKLTEAGADARRNFCYGFAQGAIDTQRRLASDKPAFCMPRPGPSRTETMNQFVEWVGASADRRSIPSGEALFRFLGERYPCKS
jgi:hypothetical protein